MDVDGLAVVNRSSDSKIDELQDALERDKVGGLEVRVDDLRGVDRTDGLEHLLPVQTNGGDVRKHLVFGTSLVHLLQKTREINVTEFKDDLDALGCDLMLVHVHNARLVAQGFEELDLVLKDVKVF